MANSVPTHKPLSPFGEHLRMWRRRRGMTQMALAHSAGSTSRHVSFLETGRSRPGRDIVLRLADALNVPLVEKNSMLAAAGLTPEFQQWSFDDQLMQPVRDVIDRIMSQHEPFPAWCVGRGLQFLDGNETAKRLFPNATDSSGIELLDAWFRPGPLRNAIENWQELLHVWIGTLRRELLVYADQAAQELLDHALEMAKELETPAMGLDFPVVCPIIRVGDQRIRTISTALRFDTAAEITTSSLKVELMFPVDSIGEEFFAQLASAPNHH